MAKYDWRSAPTWASRTPSERMALMALMERDGDDYDSGVNVLHANYNRAQQKGWDTDRLLNFKADKADYGWFQPLYEPAQHKRAEQLLQHPDFQRYVAEYERRARNEAEDRVKGATHYLSHPATMLALEKKEPKKYQSWREWTKFDPATQQYGNQTIADRSHTFLAPEGLVTGSNRPADQQKSAQIAALLANDADVGPAEYKAAGAILSPQEPKMAGPLPISEIGAAYGPPPQQVGAAPGSVDPRLLASTAAREQQIKALLGMVNPNVRHPLQAFANAATMGVAGQMMRENEKTGRDKNEALIDLLARKTDGSVDPLLAGAVATGNMPWSQALKQREDAATREKMLIAVTERINSDPELDAAAKASRIKNLAGLDGAALKQVNENYVNKTFDPKESAAQQKIKRTVDTLVAKGMPLEEAKLWAQAVADNQVVLSQDGTALTNKQTMEVYDAKTMRKITLPGGPQFPNAPGAAGAQPGAPGGDGAVPTKEQVNQAQQRAIQQQAQLRQLDEVHNSFTPDALTIGGQTKRAIDSLAGWISGSEVFDTAKDQERFRASTTQFFNSYRKAITGAAAAEKELAALEDATINLKLTPPQFMARLNAIRDMARKELGAEMDILNQGIKRDPSTPLPAAAGGPKPVPKKKEELKVGQSYVISGNRVAKWDGDGFILEGSK